MKVKVIAIIIVILLVVNLVLFITRKISNLVFWVVIACCALIAYKGIPKLSNKN